MDDVVTNRLEFDVSKRVVVGIFLLCILISLIYNPVRRMFLFSQTPNHHDFNEL